MAPDFRESLRSRFRAAQPAARPLDRLLRAEKRGGGGRGYTRFVRAMRLVLPLMAAGIIGLLVSWPRVEERITPPPAITDPLPQTVGQNELIDPRFESEDKKQRPFTITAARALQSSANPDIALLEKPAGDLLLADGQRLSAAADQGAFDQKNETLALEGAVRIAHDNGYSLHMEKLRLDLKTRSAWSDTPLHGSGPAGSLTASGVTADAGAERIVFTGPAKLVLHETVRGLR